VTGVEVRRHGQDEVLPADLAVDATGRRSPLPRWFEGIGALRPGEESEDSGIFYCSRFYRMKDGAEPPQRETTIGADLGYLKYAIFHGDSGIFSITFAASPQDAPLRALLRLGPFEAATRVLPPMAGWVDPAVAEPITDVHGMANLRNTRRFTIREGEPLALGVIPIGDASIHTNPLYGRGCTFALVHAYLLADAVREHPDDLRALALAVEAATEREIVPTYAMTVTQDRGAREVAAGYARGEEPTEQPEGDGPVDPKAYMRSLLRHGLLPAVRSDPDVSRTFFRGFNLLTPAADLMKDPLVLGKVLEFYQRRHERQEPSMGPRRPEILTLLEAAS
jgi:2-polyprenyl-6-methoxyphenol hydroxylase-like FAD-dependent oxidoreductase